MKNRRTTLYAKRGSTVLTILRTILSLSKDYTLYAMLIALVCLILPQIALAKTIYVDNQLPSDCIGTYSIANRDNSGTDGDAYNTIQKAVNAAFAGDTVYFRGGTYSLTASITISNKTGTSPSAKIAFVNYGSEEVVIHGPASPVISGIVVTNSSYIVLNGLKITGFGGSGIVYDRSPYGQIQNVHVANSGSSGILVSSSDNTVIKDVSVSGSKIHGVYSAESDYLSLTGSVIYDNLGAGAYWRGSSYGTIDRNELYNNSLGISTVWRDTNQHTSTNNIISNNLAHNNIIVPEGSDGIAIGTGSTNNFITDNIVYANYDDGIDASTGGGAQGLGSNLYETITGNIAFNNGDGPEITSSTTPGYWQPCRENTPYCAYDATLNMCHYGCGDGNGIKVSTNNGGGHLVGNNIALDNERCGFDQDKELGFPQNYFYNNIAYRNEAGGFLMDAPSLPQNEDAILYNNIATNNSVMDLRRSNDLAVSDSDYNLWGDGRFISGMDAHSLSGDPLFNSPDLAVDTNFGAGWSIDQKLEFIRNQVKEKFSLQAESQAIDKGTVIPGYHCDTDGAHPGEACKEWYGTAPDIGAYEYNPDSGTILYGDVSGDSEITAYDAALTAQAAVGLITLTAEQTQKADVSGDAEVSAYDAALIAQRAVGLIERFPVEP